LPIHPPGEDLEEKKLLSPSKEKEPEKETKAPVYLGKKEVTDSKEPDMKRIPKPPEPKPLPTPTAPKPETKEVKKQPKEKESIKKKQAIKKEKRQLSKEIKKEEIPAPEFPGTQPSLLKRIKENLINKLKYMATLRIQELSTVRSGPTELREINKKLGIINKTLAKKKR
jgi:hypothetical protein